MKSAQKKEHKTFSYLLLILILVAFALAWHFFPLMGKKTAPEAAPRELSLNVVKLLPQDVEITKSYIGYVMPIHEVDIVPYISGFLEKIYVSGGQYVDSGDKLILIRPDEYQASLDAAKAAVMEAKATLNNASVYYERMKQAGTEVISKTELDNAKASYLNAKAALAQAQAKRNLAQVNLDYTLISAPISGTVGNVNLTRGDYVSPSGGSLLKIIQFDPIRVVFSISDKDYLNELARSNGDLFAGENIKIRLSNGQIYEQSGEFQFLDNQIDRSTNSIAVYADFKNPHHTLVANAYVDVLLEKTVKNAVLVRQNQVTMEDSGNYVYVAKDNQIERRLIEIIGIKGDDYVLKNTFAPGEYLVIDKFSSRLSPDQKFKLNILDRNSGEGKR